MNWDLVIFDMDGTVLDTLVDLLSAMNHALKVHGLGERTLDEMRSYVGNGLYMMAKRAVPEGTDEETVLSVFRAFKAYYADHLNVETKPYAGIKPLLERLKKEGTRIGISSNKFDPGAKMLAEVHFGDLVDITVGESEAVPKKPDPAGADLIRAKLGISREKTVYVGDSGVDVETAKNAGLAFIGVSWGFRTAAQLAEAGAKVIADTPEQLGELLLRRGPFAEVKRGG